MTKYVQFEIVNIAFNAGIKVEGYSSMRTKQLLWTTIIVSILIYWGSINLAGTPNEWTIAYQVIPKRLATSDANINIIVYLLKQTHLPIFNESEPNQYDSAILKTWSRNPNYTFFIFCPNTNLSFSETVNFSKTHLLSALNKAKVDIGEDLMFNELNNCIHVKSKRSIPNFLKTLTDYRYAPTIPCEENWECGLGLFTVSELNENAIRLSRKITTKNSKQFNSILLAQPEHFRKQKVYDINRTIEKLPHWVTLEDYKSFELSMLQTIVVLLNIPDKQVRSVLANCINSNDLRQAFNPELASNQMIPINTILPSDIYNSESYSKANCKPLNKTTQPYYFVNWRTNNKTDLSNYLKKIKKLTNISISTFDIAPSEFVEELLNRKSKFKKFHIIPMAIGAENKDFSSFFRPLVSDNRSYLSYRIYTGEQTYNRLLESTDKYESLNLARSLADIVRTNFMAIPLYQVKRTFYYPKNIANLNTGQNFLEYPEVGALEIK